MFRLLNLYRASRSIRHAQSLSRAGMLALQERRWRALARRAFATSPFYRRQLAGLDLDRCALSDIPVLTKATLVENWDEIVSDPRLRWSVLQQHLKNPQNWGKLLHGRWMVSTTSGTSGAAVAIPHDITAVDWNHAVHAVRTAPTTQNSSAPKPSLFGKRPVVASFICLSVPSTSAALLQTRPWVGSLFCDYQPISVTAPWQEIIDQLHKIKPTILIGYASLIGRLAQAKLDGTLKLELPTPGGAISTGGDCLTPGIRSLCRQAFGIEPMDGYGCGEALGIARQWSGMQHLLVFEDIAVFEAVDQNEQESPAEVLSDHTLVTPLFNTALPLLRYRIDDRVRFGPAPAGWPFKVIHELSGRSAMTYNFRTPEKVVLVGTKFLAVLQHQPEVTAYQFRQTSADSIECLFVAQSGADKNEIQLRLETSIRQCLIEGGCASVRFRAIPVHHLESDPRTGKVEQNVPLKE
jgi:phenylacetate-CoA ligase